MPRPLIICSLFIGVVLVGAFLGVAFVHNSPSDSTPKTPSELNNPGPVTNLSDDMHISIDTLTKLDWQTLDKMLRGISADRNKIDQVLQNTADVQNPAALYLRGFALMINSQPLQALTVFSKLSVRDIPENFLYPVYRLHKQMQPGSVSFQKYLQAMKRAISSGSVSPLIAARVEAQEGDLYAALANYLKTDPAQWVTYDVKCITRIAQHSGLNSEVLRMISGAVKSQRLSKAVEEPLSRLLTTEKDLPGVTTFKKSLKRELEQDSSSGKIALSSIKQMLDNRTVFLQRDYQKLLSTHKDTNPLMVTNESVLILFLSSVQLKNQLEMDRWGQEIKRRYPNREVAEWVSEMTTSVE